MFELVPIVNYLRCLNACLSTTPYPQKVDFNAADVFSGVEEKGKQFYRRICKYLWKSVNQINIEHR